MLKNSQHVTRDEHATINNVDGKKVFVIDDSGNQITQFSNATIDINTGSKVIITNGDNDAYVWDSGALTMGRAIHWRIKESKEFFGNHSFTSVSDGASVYLQIKTGAKSAHGNIFVCSDGKLNFNLYENPTLHANGATITSFCMNRETTANSTTTLLSTPSINSEGTFLENGITGSAGKFTATGGDITGAYWWLKPNEDYLVKTTNSSGTDSDICVKYNWHEHVAVA